MPVRGMEGGCLVGKVFFAKSWFSFFFDQIVRQGILTRTPKRRHQRAPGSPHGPAAAKALAASGELRGLVAAAGGSFIDGAGHGVANGWK